jgi:phytoene/squalene synthetase
MINLVWLRFIPVFAICNTHMIWDSAWRCGSAGILRDLAEDAARHRLYLPRELLHAHGIFATTPSWVFSQPALPDVCRDLATLAEGHYAAAAEAIAACPRWKMRAAAVTLGTHRARLHALLARGWRHLDEPVQMPAWRKLPQCFIRVWPDAEQPDLNRAI